MHQGNMSDSDYLGITNNLVDMVYLFKGKLHYHGIVDIVIEEIYSGGSYKILEPDNK